jgi:hypothetical protein
MTETEKKLYVALGMMVRQYCDWKDDEHGDCLFHMFMSAGETAFEVLEDAGLLRHLGRENYVLTDAYEALYREVSP